MEGTRYTVTLEEFRLFHGIDRALFIILVRDLARLPSECMYIMGLWLWLERAGFYNFISKVLCLPPFLIDELADEAVACLSCLHIQFPIPPELNEIPLTHSLVQKDISLQFFRENPAAVFREIQTMVRGVCIPTLSDILQNGPPGFANKSFRRSIMGPAHGASSSSCQMRAPASPMQAPTSPMQRTTAPKYNGEGSSYRGRRPRNEQERQQMQELIDRTMFVTFSKGYPVSEQEVRRFFYRNYGDCIESFHMQEVRRGEQALYARIVFYSPDYIRDVLKGASKAKFCINGKHVWMRQFKLKEDERKPCGCLRKRYCSCRYYNF